MPALEPKDLVDTQTFTEEARKRLQEEAKNSSADEHSSRHGEAASTADVVGGVGGIAGQVSSVSSTSRIHIPSMGNSASGGARRARRATLRAAAVGVVASRNGVVALALVTRKGTAAGVDTVARLSITAVGAVGRLPAAPALGRRRRGVAPDRDTGTLRGATFATSGGRVGGGGATGRSSSGGVPGRWWRGSAAATVPVGGVVAEALTDGDGWER
jgi:hypothetical protein